MGGICTDQVPARSGRGGVEVQLLVQRGGSARRATKGYILTLKGGHRIGCTPCTC